MVILFFTDCIESFVFSFRFISVLVPNSQNLCLLGPSWTLKVQTLSSVRDRALLHLWMLRCNYRRSSIKCKYRAAILFFCLKTVICSIKVCLICSLRKIVWDKIFNKWLFWLTPPDPVLKPFHPTENCYRLSLQGRSLCLGSARLCPRSVAPRDVIASAWRCGKWLCPVGPVWVQIWETYDKCGLQV